MKSSIAYLLLGLWLVACGDARREEPGPEPAGPVCPPCRMAVQPHYGVIEAQGLRFGICNPRCGEIVRADPARFAADALP